MPKRPEEWPSPQDPGVKFAFGDDARAARFLSECLTLLYEDAGLLPLNPFDPVRESCRLTSAIVASGLAPGNPLDVHKVVDLGGGNKGVLKGRQEYFDAYEREVLARCGPFTAEWTWDDDGDKSSSSGTAHFPVPSGDTVDIKFDRHSDFSFLRSLMEAAYCEGKNDGFKVIKRTINHTLWGEG